MMVSIALQDIGPLSVAAGRIVIGAVILLLINGLKGNPLPTFSGSDGRKIWLAALGFGFFSMALPFFLLSWGQQYVASGFAGVTMAAVPLLVLPLAHFMVPGDRITLPKGLGFVIGFSGVMVLIGLNAFDSLGTALEPLARLACFGAAACYAIGSIIARVAPKVDPIAFAATATTLAAFMITPIAIFVEGVPATPSTLSIIAVLFLGIIPTAVANLLLVAIIRSAGPTFFSLVNYQVPIWSVVFGALFLSEALPSRTVFALALILAGVGISQWTTLRRLVNRG
ncbi:MAG: EamA family transporter [Marinosulfonomonas sp.]|nr:MAG: EamA family transporter [Marinosulfonomonas sp.]